MVDGFLRLRHHAVIGGDHQHHDVGNFRAARAHARERFVARRVDEHDPAIARVHFGRADVLRDSAGFSRGDFGFANGVEQAGLAVIDVAHHGHHRQRAAADFRCALPRSFLPGRRCSSNVTTCTMPLKASARLVAVGTSSAWLMLAKMPRSSKVFSNFLGANIQLFRQIANRDAFGDRYCAWLALDRRDRLDVRGAACSPTPARVRTG